MKKLFVSTAVFLSLCLFVIFSLNISKNEISSAQNSEKTELKTESIYIVKEHKGRIAAFEEENAKPFRTTEILVEDLPEGDRELLKEGIKVSGFEELSKILEDYVS